MELINAARMVAGYNMDVGVGGRELLVVVIKGTVLPKRDESVRLADTRLAGAARGQPRDDGQSHPALDSNQTAS